MKNILVVDGQPLDVDAAVESILIDREVKLYNTDEERCNSYIASIANSSALPTDTIRKMTAMVLQDQRLKP